MPYFSLTGKTKQPLRCENGSRPSETRF